MSHLSRIMDYKHATTLHFPSPVASLALTGGDDLYVGADDGSIRSFTLPSTRVTKAIRGLPDEVSSIVPASQSKGHPHTRQIWVASGDTVHLFDLGVDKLVLSSEHASLSSVIGTSKDDVVNELSLSGNGSNLAFVSDNGVVGVMDTATRRISRMKTMHANIAGTVQFIPDRPNELVSGGYDCMLYHFDHNQGSVLSKQSCELSGPPSTEGGVSFSPPFVLCSAMSPTGILAAGTADGRIWVGLGGEKGTTVAAGKKKARKWGGLASESGLELVVADGPVVGVAFTSSSTLAVASLLGTVSHLQLVTAEQGTVCIKRRHIVENSSLAKANALASDGKWLVLGGFTTEGKGIVEVWLGAE